MTYTKIDFRANSTDRQKHFDRNFWDTYGKAIKFLLGKRDQSKPSSSLQPEKYWLKEDQKSAEEDKKRFCYCKKKL